MNILDVSKIIQQNLNYINENIDSFKNNSISDSLSNFEQLLADAINSIQINNINSTNVDNDAASNITNTNSQYSDTTLNQVNNTDTSKSQAQTSTQSSTNSSYI